MATVTSRSIVVLLGASCALAALRSDHPTQRASRVSRAHIAAPIAVTAGASPSAPVAAPQTAEPSCGPLLVFPSREPRSRRDRWTVAYGEASTFIAPFDPALDHVPVFGTTFRSHKLEGYQDWFLAADNVVRSEVAACRHTSRSDEDRRARVDLIVAPSGQVRSVRVHRTNQTFYPPLMPREPDGEPPQPTAFEACVIERTMRRQLCPFERSPAAWMSTGLLPWRIDKRTWW